MLFPSHHINWVYCSIIRIPLRKRSALTMFTDTRVAWNNCKVTYYGKAYWHFFTRAAEHMGISYLAGKRLKSVKQSAVAPVKQNDQAISVKSISLKHLLIDFYHT